MSQFDRISRLNIVFSHIINLVQEDEEYGEKFIEDLNAILEDHNGSDDFGAEGQNDPRGDQRTGLYTLWNVEGYDE